MHALHLGSADWCFLKPGVDAHAYYHQLKSLGYQGAEMVDPARRPAAKSAGLTLVNYAGPSDLNRIEDQPVKIAQLQEAIRAAAADAIGQLIVFSGNRQGQSDDVGVRNCIANLKCVAADAERMGVVLTLEVFNQFDHPDYQCDSGKYAFEVAKAVSSSHVKVLYDLYHMHRMGEDVAAEVVANLGYVAHLHVAGSPDRDFPGAGQSMDYPTIVRRIVEAGYQGFWGMEFKPAGESLVELERAGELFQSYAAGDGR